MENPWQYADKHRAWFPLLGPFHSYHMLSSAAFDNKKKSRDNFTALKFLLLIFFDDKGGLNGIVPKTERASEEIAAKQIK